MLGRIVTLYVSAIGSIMKEIRLNHSILSPIPVSLDLNSSETRYSKCVKEFSRVEEGTCLFEFKYRSEVYKVISDISGIIEYPISSSIKEGQTLCKLYDSYEELVDHLFSNSYDIIEDEFTKEISIKWKVYSGYRNDLSVFRFGEGFRFNRFYFTLNLNILQGKPILRFLFYTDKQGGIRIKKGDTISLLFSDRSILDFIVSSKPYKSGLGVPDSAVDVDFEESDINALKDKDLSKIRIAFANGDAPATIINDLSGNAEVSYLLLKRYVKEYESILTNLGVKWEKSVQETASPTSQLGQLSDPCYVYLMIDKANGFHKIGISNHPEYREGTLQSEKPTIELVCAKQFPSRVIASAIESALHSAFGEKRLRGEWFKLTEKDVNDIRLTLK